MKTLLLIVSAWVLRILAGMLLLTGIIGLGNNLGPFEGASLAVVAVALVYGAYRLDRRVAGSRAAML
jgi:hypothetical protein